MKKVFYLSTLVIGLMVFLGCTSSQINEVSANNEIVYDYESVQNEIIRFHVIANSDSDKDQELKLKVRDEVIKFLSPLLDKSSSIEESREILKENDEEVKKIAKKVIKENGYKYSVESQLSRENFPEKIYGNIILPQGEYEAYRILIGKSSGQNWWCVMFPPLCFVDVTKGEVAYNETERQMNEVVNKNNQENNEVENNIDIEVNNNIKSEEQINNDEYKEEDAKNQVNNIIENNSDEKINQPVEENKEADLNQEIEEKEQIVDDKQKVILDNASNADLEVNNSEIDNKKIEDDTTVQEDSYNVKLKGVEVIKDLFE